MLARIALLVFRVRGRECEPGCRTHYALFATHLLRCVVA